MKRYLVGGAVRDTLLGRAARDRDWVVVGATPDEMLQAGYRSVAKGMPVFVDPKTGEEHALARLERKAGTGHKGFTFVSSPQVSLEEDLQRRDLTVNAMAQDEAGQIIDPYGGREDLHHKVLRHVSEAFSEDPLRVFRVARFAAELASLGFAVADQTLALMRKMAASGELASLPAERVWQETQRALQADRPGEYFRVLQECAALGDWFAELLPHPDIDSLQTACSLEPPWRWAGMVWQLQEPDLKRLHDRLKPPKAYSRAAATALALLPLIGQGRQISPAERYRVLQRADAFRQPEHWRALLQLHQCLSGDPPADWWHGAWQAAQQAGSAIAKPPQTEQNEYSRLLHQERIRALEQWN